MQQNDRRALAQHAVSDLRIVAFYLLKSNRLHEGAFGGLLIADF
jgi:hypothetical protein